MKPRAKPEFRPWDPRIQTLKVKSLKEKVSRGLVSAKDILEELTSEGFALRRLLDAGNISKDTIETVISLVVHVCDHESTRKVQALINEVGFSDNFMFNHVVNYLSQVTSDQTEDCNKMLLELLEFFHHFQSSFPASAIQKILVILPLMENGLEKLKERGVSTVKHEDLIKTIKSQKTEFVTNVNSKRRQWEEQFQLKEPPNDFRCINIAPKSGELLSKEEPFLRPNLVQGKYQDVDHYLDVQFRLLREDFVRPLRETVQKLKQVGITPEAVKEISNGSVYLNVMVCGIFSTEIGVVHGLRFDSSRLKHVKWETSKRFLPGSLLCLTHDSFQTVFFATVAQREVEDLKRGILYVVFEEHPDLQNVEGYVFVVVETSTYFEAYKHTLLALQNVSFHQLPFERYLVKAEKSVESPAYLKSETEYDLSCVMKPSRLRFRNKVRLLDESSWPSEDEFLLDNSQLHALKTCLTKEFSIVQGPPGTGKTYIGTKVVEILLENRIKLSTFDLCKLRDIFDYKKPILVVCYTNHALDQFLENILQAQEDYIRLVRVGGRSESKALETYNLHNLRQGSCSAYHKEKIWKLRCLCEDVNSKIQHHMKKISLAYKVQVSLEEFSNHMSVKHFQELANFSRQYLKISSYSPRNVVFMTWLELNAIYEDFLANHGSTFNETVLTDPSVEADRNGEENYDISTYTEKVIDEGVRINTKESLSNHAEETVEEYLWYRHLYSLVQNGKTLPESYEININAMKCDFEGRWKLYRLWVHRYVREQNMQINLLRSYFFEIETELKRLRELSDYVTLRSAAIIGMTTTGASKYESVLSRIRPKIVIIEEAAEVLESHIISCLTSDTQHLILIGDHKQLRPTSAVYELSRKYNMDVSLFERMLNNGLACSQLEIQHRMRPSIRSLLVPEFYENLFDHLSVILYPDIKGMTTSMFFLQHSVKENEESEGKSHSNVYEADFVVALAKYLLNQGYESSRITILTTYTGQMFLIREKLAKVPSLLNIRTTVVDNFQGEENDIIILSFVRSNSNGSMGFLKIPNRVCVSLSRSKQGFYCIGNFIMFTEHSEVWKNIADKLKDQGAIGTSLSLCCSRHPETVSKVTKAEDFNAKVPDGGCQLPCNSTLPCGHFCPLNCHPDDRHHLIQCKKQCTKKCPKGHTCRLKCHQKCLEDCKESCNTVYQECNHKCPLKCHERCSSTCSVPCTKLLACGHMCKNECGEKCTSLCSENVSIEGTCGHTFKIACYQSETVRVCPERCDKLLECGHRCGETCGEQCSLRCLEMVTLVTACGHENKIECSYLPQADRLIVCREPVKRLLHCGHERDAPCFESASCVRICDHKSELETCSYCDASNCKEFIEHGLPCGHKLKIVCSERSTVTPDMCTAPCDYKLECGHTCSSVCGKCLYGGIHKCLQKCEKILPCGHTCKGKCKNPCRPCNEKCQTACPHKTCLLACGLPCLPCTLPCKQNCPHFKCYKRCSEPCDRQPCIEPCQKLLKCRHRCSGYCGEACPFICSVCRKPLFRKLTKGRVDAMLTKVYPCGHFMAGDELNEMVLVAKNEAKDPRCPTCNSAIRYNLSQDKFFKDSQLEANKKKQALIDESGKVPKNCVSTLVETTKKMTSSRAQFVRGPKQYRETSTERHWKRGLHSQAPSLQYSKDGLDLREQLIRHGVLERDDDSDFDYDDL